LLSLLEAFFQPLVLTGTVVLRAISARELDILAFQVLRVMDNPEINKYLKWLASEYEERSHVMPHRDAQYLAEQLKKLREEKLSPRPWFRHL